MDIDKLLHKTIIWIWLLLRGGVLVLGLMMLLSSGFPDQFLDILRPFGSSDLYPFRIGFGEELHFSFVV